MPNPGDILYAQNAKQVYEPVTVKTSQEIEREAPNGEKYTDLIVTVENQKNQTRSDYAYHFQFVPYIAEVEASLTEKSP